jgi:hypothetical protein
MISLAFVRQCVMLLDGSIYVSGQHNNAGDDVVASMHDRVNYCPSVNDGPLYYARLCMII